MRQPSENSINDPMTLKIKEANSSEDKKSNANCTSGSKT